MHIALLGGTGDIGEGLALRLERDTDHDVTIGSRESEKASAAAAEYKSTLVDRGIEASIDGQENPAAASDADVVVLSVPAYYLGDTIEAVETHLEDTVVVSPAVGMKRDEAGMHYNPPSTGSVTELAAKTAPDGTSIAGAFHNLAADRLADLDADLEWDVPVVATDPETKGTIVELVDELDGLRPLDAGDLSNAAEVESLTPLLINLAANNEGLHDLGVTFH